MSKQMTLKSGKKVTLVEMSVDEFDKCMDSIEFTMQGDQAVIKNQFSSSTMWIRAGVKKVDDKFNIGPIYFQKSSFGKLSFKSR